MMLKQKWSTTEHTKQMANIVKTVRQQLRKKKKKRKKWCQSDTKGIINSTYAPQKEEQK